MKFLKFETKIIDELIKVLADYTSIKIRQVFAGILLFDDTSIQAFQILLLAKSMKWHDKR